MNHNDYLNIIKNGKFYFPASAHYNYESSNVQCDRCFRNDLSISIGYMDRDLCLNCAEIIADKLRCGSSEGAEPKKLCPFFLCQYF